MDSNEYMTPYTPFFENDNFSEIRDLFIDTIVTLERISMTIEDLFPFVKKELNITRKPLASNKIFIETKLKESNQQPKWDRLDDLFKEAEDKLKKLVKLWRTGEYNEENYQKLHVYFTELLRIVCKGYKDYTTISSVDITKPESSSLVRDYNIHFLLKIVRQHYIVEEPDREKEKLTYELELERQSLQVQTDVLHEYLEKLKRNWK